MYILKCCSTHTDFFPGYWRSIFQLMRRPIPLQGLFVTFFVVTCFAATCVFATPPRFSPVVRDMPLTFPHDFGDHPSFRNEWWYATGWLETPEKKPLGFQITFFRVATEHDRTNPSRFAPQHLIIAHAALSDPAAGKLLHDQKSAREGFGLAYTKEGNTDVKLGDWYLVREENGRYQTSIKAEDFMLHLSLTPTQPPMLQDINGFSRKGPRPEQASYYYSEPQLLVSGTVTRTGKEIAVSGVAWLDHEWSTAYLDPAADGWDWVGANLDDGSSLMAFRIRGKDGGKVWAYAGIRDPSGRFTKFEPEQVTFEPQRTWRSPLTNATYPVEMQITTGSTVWLLTPLQDDQELDSRQSTGAVYWEGAVTVTRDGEPAGRGYYEMTGYVEPLEL
ncbi:Predicted secreted hydrolase [Nitrosospira briensis]|nr:Predicted secreted hydrolase [Nitrosospira briensis]